MSNPLGGSYLEAGSHLRARAATTDTYTELLSVDSSGVVQLGDGLTGVDIANLDVATLDVASLLLGGTALTATATEINRVADLSAFAGTATATATGATTGTLTATGVLNFYTVTSANADHIIVLPTPTPGTIVILVNGATGYELRSSAPATVAINGGAEADAESAIGASHLVIAVCKSATAWAAIELDGTTLAAVPAAAAS